MAEKNRGDRSGAGRRGFCAFAENEANRRIAEREEAFAQKARVERMRGRGQGDGPPF